MATFRFRLARVLDWRNDLCQLEKNRLTTAYAALARVSTAIEESRVEQLKTERALLASTTVAAPEFQALTEYRRAREIKSLQLREDVRRSERDIWIHMENLKKAQINVHLLEKLRDRRLQEHTYAANRELEELAADTYLAKFAREM